MITTFFPARPSATAPGTFVRMPDCQTCRVADSTLQRLITLLWAADAWHSDHWLPDPGGLAPVDLIPTRDALSRALFAPSGLTSAFWFSSPNADQQLCDLYGAATRMHELMGYCINSSCHLRWESGND